MGRYVSFVYAILISSILVVPATGDIIYNNLGPDDSYNTGTGWTIGSSANLEVGPELIIGGGQDVGVNFFLDSVDAAIGYSQGVNQIELSLFDSVDGLPGNVLETVVVTNLPIFGRGDPPTTFEFSGNTVLEAGTTYFLIASSVNDGNSSLAWNWNSTGDIGNTAARENSGPWNVFPDSTRAAFRVHGKMVPEPAALALLPLGTVGFLLQRRRIGTASLRIRAVPGDKLA